MTQTQKTIKWVLLGMMSLSAVACSNAMPGKSSTNWEQLTASTSVADVSGMSQLIQPGMR